MGSVTIEITSTMYTGLLSCMFSILLDVQPLVFDCIYANTWLYYIKLKTGLIMKSISEGSLSIPSISFILLILIHLIKTTTNVLMTQY